MGVLYKGDGAGASDSMGVGALACRPHPPCPVRETEGSESQRDSVGELALTYRTSFPSSAGESKKSKGEQQQRGKLEDGRLSPARGERWCLKVVEASKQWKLESNGG